VGAMLFLGKPYLQFLIRGQSCGLKFEVRKIIFIQNWSPKMIFLNEFKNQKDSVDFYIEN
jgi:hypothetical protein